MNNNFTFHYQKQLEEEKQKEFEHKKANENERIIKEEKEEPKKKSKRKYIVYAFLAIVFVIYALLSSSSYLPYDPNHNQNPSSNSNSNEDSSKEEENTINKDIFAILSEKNYMYSNKIEIIRKEEKEEYLYKGEKKDSVLSIMKSINQEEKEYTYQEGKYFYQDNEVLEEEVYDAVNKQYIDLNYIKDYVEHASLYSTTIYKTGEIVKVYHLLLKEIIIGYQEEDYITIEIDQKDTEHYFISLDYTNIVSLVEEEITSYLVNMEFQIMAEDVIEP